MALNQAGRQTKLVAEQPFTYADFAGGDGTYIAADLPPGSIVTGGHINVGTAFDSTTNAVNIGDSGSATRYGSAVDLKTTGATALTGANLPFYNSNGLSVAFVYSETGTAPTAGAGTLVVEYIIEGRAVEAQ